MPYAKLRGASTIFCGHTHQAMASGKDGVHHFNSGCWSSNNPTYLSVSEAGGIIHEYWSEVDALEAPVERG